jgi:hypothetical protein
MRNAPWVSRFLGGPDFGKCRGGISRELFLGRSNLRGRWLFRLRFGRGATQLGFVDVLTAVILLGILLWVATMQFAVYKTAPAASASASSTATSH